MILVTGATGITGSFVVAELLRRGQRVRVLTRKPYQGNVEVAVGDLHDPDSLRRAAEGTTGIVHAACTYTDSAVDIAAMRALLEGWRHGPFVFLSTLDVYGLDVPPLVTEEAPLCETYNDYSRGKIVCEQLLGEAANGRSHAMLRLPLIWGPHPTARKRILGSRIPENLPVVLPGVTEKEWSEYVDVWVDARDLAQIVVASLEKPVAGPLNVLSGHLIWHDVYAELIRLTGSKCPLVHKPLDEITDEELLKKHLYALRWRFSEAKLAATLGSFPRRPLDETLRDTVVYLPRNP